jgi:hypothetical protein
MNTTIAIKSVAFAVAVEGRRIVRAYDPKPALDASAERIINSLPLVPKHMELRHMLVSSALMHRSSKR